MNVFTSVVVHFDYISISEAEWYVATRCCLEAASPRLAASSPNPKSGSVTSIAGLAGDKHIGTHPLKMPVLKYIKLKLSDTS